MKTYKPETQLTFGKCKGEILRDIYQFNPGYIEWLIKYTDSFFIDVDDFKPLPIPTPYFVEKKHHNMFWFDERANFVKEARLILKEGGLILEKEFDFSDETVEILKQKKEGDYKAPPYTFIRDMQDLFIP